MQTNVLTCAWVRIRCYPSPKPRARHSSLWLYTVTVQLFWEYCQIDCFEFLFLILPVALFKEYNLSTLLHPTFHSSHFKITHFSNARKEGWYINSFPDPDPDRDRRQCLHCLRNAESHTTTTVTRPSVASVFREFSSR